MGLPFRKLRFYRTEIFSSPSGKRVERLQKTMVTLTLHSWAVLQVVTKLDNIVYVCVNSWNYYKLRQRVVTITIGALVKLTNSERDQLQAGLIAQLVEHRSLSWNLHIQTWEAWGLFDEERKQLSSQFKIRGISCENISWYSLETFNGLSLKFEHFSSFGMRKIKKKLV